MSTEAPPPRSAEPDSALERRASVHAALADPARLRLVDALLLGDASPSELAAVVAMPSNLLAHHLRVLERAGLVARRRSEGDGRRSYLRLVPEVLALTERRSGRTAPRVLFVCTANSARSHLAAALWRRHSPVPAASAGTHPAPRIAPGAVAAAGRHHLPLPRVRPRLVTEVHHLDDLVVTVCDRAHEEFGHDDDGATLRADLHWSVPDPVGPGTDDAFDAALTDLGRRVERLAPLVDLLPEPTP